MAYQPVPLTQQTGVPNAVFKPVPVDYDGVPAPAPVDPVVQALIAAGFGTAGQVLATNAGGDGFEWVTP